MLEMILSFMRHTGIHEDTFGRLTINDAKLVMKLRKDMELNPDAADKILRFMHSYEDSKE